ncbi:serine protease Do [Caloramator quimbayensis]|uniref:Serine protease Do n=1 Tax=Caloramator quimbayensis TaxID=1147123 RepID=A0A1T4WSZ8_9CLOT|nr:trypsin-like peptidase domain-containing protein [Caloramator quimbayensis]SKA79968.1 serine protease Do [Caloramator quimbayensis]
MDELHENKNETALCIIDNSSSENVSSVKKVKRAKNKFFMAFIATAVVSSIIGGLIVGALGFFVLPKTDMFNKYIQSKVESSKENQTYNIAPKATLTSNLTQQLTIPEIAKKVGPAVVGITTKSFQYFNNFDVYGQEVDSVGSGIIFSSDGYIVTNYHVIQGAQQVKVIFNNGKEVNAKVVNYDSDFDIAVVKITDDVKVPGVAEFGDSDSIEVGETAVAIGNPLGKDLLGSVTAGVISALNRQVDVNNKNLTFIQTDAAINPGNSGGALVNSRGQVIGINTAKISANNVEGIGFAIPINIVKSKIDVLSKPLVKIGIVCRDITSDLAKRYNLPVGVYVLQVEEFSPAERAGIQSGDIITEFAGQTVKTTSDINKIKSNYKVNDNVKVKIIRDGKSLTVNLKLSES